MNTADKGSSFWQRPRVRRTLAYVIVALVAFLIGLIPMWITAGRRASQLETTQDELRRQQIRHALATATIWARRGEYEQARQTTSRFFTMLREEEEKGEASVFTNAQRNRIQSIHAQQDEVITLLARGDPAAAERLSDLYVAFQSALGGENPASTP